MQQRRLMALKWEVKILLVRIPIAFIVLLLFAVLNNIHYPCHRPRGSIFPVLQVRCGSLWSDGVSFPACTGDWRPNFQPNILICLGKRKLMKAEDEGICVNSTHDFSFFPISALVTCLNTLITAPFINLTASAHVSFMSEWGPGQQSYEGGPSKIYISLSTQG